MRDWGDFKKFNDADEKYLPIRGEGDTMASQITTAVCKLVYKWYNDGDVFDNTGHLKGWCNDLSSYGNWLYNYCGEAQSVFVKWWFGDKIRSYSDYEDFLYELCEKCQTLDVLEKYEVKKEGSIYECKGPFKFIYDEGYYDEEEL